MALLPGGQFDPSQHADMRTFEVLPPGDYIAKVTASELKDTSNKQGKMLVLDSTVVAGPLTGKVFTTRLNLVNPNAEAMKIANEELATLCRACGLGPITQSEQLHGIAYVVTLGIQAAEGKYGPSNTVTGYKTAAGLTAPPINPEPDETTLAIMKGVARNESVTPQAPSAPATPPAGFAPPPPPPPPPAGFAPPPPPPPPPGVGQSYAPPGATQPETTPQPENTQAPPASTPPW